MKYISIGVIATAVIVLMLTAIFLPGILAITMNNGFLVLLWLITLPLGFAGVFKLFDTIDGV